MLSQFRLLLSHLLVPRVGGVGCGGGSGGCLEAVAAFVLRRRFLHGLGLIWIGFPFEMMTTGIGEGGSQGERGGGRGSCYTGFARPLWGRV